MDSTPAGGARLELRYLLALVPGAGRAVVLDPGEVDPDRVLGRLRAG